LTNNQPASFWYLLRPNSALLTIRLSSSGVWVRRRMSLLAAGGFTPPPRAPRYETFTSIWMAPVAIDDIKLVQALFPK
jgi:hypothetical protein